MGKRLSKADLLKEIEVEKEKLDALLEGLDAASMTKKGVTPGGWSVKDILGHLIGWQMMMLGWYEAGERGEAPEVPGRGVTWRETPKLNELIYRDHVDRPLGEILGDFVQWHKKMLELIDATPEIDFIRVGRYSWAGPSWCLSDYVRANTASHYKWASNHIKRWLRARM